MNGVVQDWPRILGLVCLLIVVVFNTAVAARQSLNEPPVDAINILAIPTFLLLVFFGLLIHPDSGNILGIWIKAGCLIGVEILVVSLLIQLIYSFIKYKTNKTSLDAARPLSKYRKAAIFLTILLLTDIIILYVNI